MRTVRGKYSERTNKIIAALEGYTLLTHDEIGRGVLSAVAKRFGLTRERIRQIAKKEGFVMPHIATKPRTSKCVGCGKKFAFSRARKYCSGDCRRDYYHQKYWVEFQCEICKRKYVVKKSRAHKRGHHFCSKRCQGLWLGKTHGRGRK